MPTRQGFDEFFGLPYSHDIHPYHPQQKHFKFPPLPLLVGEEVIEMDPDADYLTKRFTERAVQFIEKNKDEPFFIYMPHPIPHVPLHVSPAYMKDLPEGLKTSLSKEDNYIDYTARKQLLSRAIAEVDWSVGQILDTLKKHGIDDNTLVIFSSDNGPALGKATPLKGKKGQTFEGGMRVPTVIHWPGKIPDGIANDEIMSTMDLLPTFAKLAGAEVPSDRVIDGKDIWPVIRGEEKSPHEAFFYYKSNKLEAVRSGKWKMHLKKQGKKNKITTILYDLEQDIGETKDVSKAHPEVLKLLLAYGKAFEKDLELNKRPAAFVENPQPLKKIK
ncbi:iduronate-sulfatase or arylsulfatase A [Lentisphaera araneosa HTCC2155]|uniref:Iduronate-sulfatase or arylsulfatase A n=1 Tax=Lentisphaera araneosa HTCC2155 TaxID=313628 RepID=A6DMV7_9BACT|nr:iduronate-sulfatase or arylsulfatase A [Lentisphaera araneosa HTCC2155]